MRDLVREYPGESADVTRFYARPPSTLFENLPKPSPWPSSLVREMRAYNEQIGSGASFNGTELTVLTGQQPALFSGPMYTVYKALTAIKLAESIQSRTGIRCIPIFWAASEDHDFEEAASAHFLTKKDEPYTLTYVPENDVSGLPMYRVPLDAWIHEAIDSAAREVRKSEQSEEIATFLHESASASASLCEWSVRLLARMFRDTPLVVFAPHLPEARAIQAEVIQEEMRDPLETVRRLDEAGTALSRLGFSPQITKAGDECSFFLEVEGRRRKVLFQENQFHLPEEAMTLSRKEMEELLHKSPERFSANVALRPVVQQRLFGEAAYVGGPSEIAYWGQLKGVFERFGQPMPVVFPRAQCVLKTAKLEKLMRKLSLSLEDLALPLEQLADKALRGIAQDNTYQSVTEGRAAIASQFEALLETLKTQDAVTREMIEAVAGRADAEFERVQGRLVHRDAERVATVQAQVRRLQHALMPWRKPQERVYTVFSFLFEHGWELIQRLLNEIDIESFQLNEVEL